MPVGWSGADPVVNVETATYELGTAQKCTQDITITHVRIWSPSSPGPVDLAGRTGTIWSTAGTVLSTVNLPTTLTAGWTTHALSSPVERTTNQQWIVSFGTGGNYGFLTGALTADVASADGAVVSLGFANAPGSQNGRFHINPGEFPQSGTAARGFYGIDVQYTLGLSGNSPPTVSALDLVEIDGTVTATATVSDVESLTGALVRFDWGDGSSSVTTWPDVTESHTYAASGIYAVLCRVTDSGGQTGYRTAPVEVTLPVDESDGFDVSAVMNALASYLGRIGAFERIKLAEPKSQLTEGLSAAIWHQSIDPIPELSSLAATAIRIEFVIRLYQNMLAEPADLIDPEMTRVVNLIFNAFHGGFTLGGLIMQIDVLPTYGQPLRSQAGYINLSGKLARAISIYVPCIIPNAFNQER